MKNTLLGRVILLPTGEINRDKMKLVPTSNMAAYLWRCENGDSMVNPEERRKAY